MTGTANPDRATEAKTGGGSGKGMPSAPRPAVAWGIAAAFALAGLLAVHTDSFLDNEGILSWMFAGLTAEAPLDMLFLLKARPPISALYAPVAVAGLPAFLSVHVVMASLAIPLTAALARRFGHANANLSASLVALSPLYFAAAAAGVQNTDATLGVLLAAWLTARKRPIAAGLVLSLVVLARVETVVLTAAFVAHAIRDRNSRPLLAAVVVIPAAFVMAGAVYHQDVLWPLHYPSSVPDNPVIDPAERAGYGGSPADAITTLLALTPVISVLVWISWRGAPLENLLTLAALAFVAALRLLPFTHLIYVDASPRYVLPALPFLALSIARAVDRWGCGRRESALRGGLLVGLGAAGLMWVGGFAGILLCATSIACAIAAALAFLSKRLAGPLLLATAAAGLWPLLPTTHLYIGDHARQLGEIVGWIETALPRGTVVVTDQHLLNRWLSARAPELQVRVRQIVQPDMQHEMRALTNPATRQFEIFFGTKRYFYAPWIFREEIVSLPGEVAVVMRTDSTHRVQALSGPPFDAVDWTVSGDKWIGGRLRRGPRGAATEVPRSSVGQ